MYILKCTIFCTTCTTTWKGRAAWTANTFATTLKLPEGLKRQSSQLTMLLWLWWKQTSMVRWINQRLSKTLAGNRSRLDATIPHCWRMWWPWQRTLWTLWARLQKKTASARLDPATHTHLLATLTHQNSIPPFPIHFPWRSHLPY